MSKILIATLLAFTANFALAATPVETCAWPHVCAAAAATPVETCAWPHVCKDQQPAAPVETCAWPHVCKQA